MHDSSSNNNNNNNNQLKIYIYIYTLLVFKVSKFLYIKYRAMCDAN